ncbi:hypothetical protein GQR58_029926 [Nymphon striatum]|nr:hypothetical protein GQR58_029926 [Nymphon striatum]
MERQAEPSAANIRGSELFGDDGVESEVVRSPTAVCFGDRHADKTVAAGLGIDLAIHDSVTRHDLVGRGEVDLVAHAGVDRQLSKVRVDFVAIGLGAKFQVENGQGNVRRRNPNGIARETASQLGQSFGHRRRRASLGDDQVQRSAAAASRLVVIVVGQILIVGVGMHRFKVARHDLVPVVHCLEYRNDRVRRA